MSVFLANNSPAAPAPSAALANPVQPYTWHQNVTLTVNFEDGRSETYPMNSKQFATPETAAKIAALFGLKVFAEQSFKPNFELSHEKLMVSESGDPASAALCAGLVAATLDLYGDAPSSLGYQLIQRDLESIK